MALAAVKAINARIRANPTLDYFCSTHFWGPASNFGIPLAAIADTQKDPEIISGRFTVALIGYAVVFMRYSLAITPKNYLLFGCHAVNFTAQTTQGYRFMNYWYWGGREQSLEQKKNQIASGAEKVKMQAEGVVNQVKDQASKGVDKVKDAVGSK